MGRPPRQIGVDQTDIEFPRMAERLLHRAFGDFIERHALDVFPLQQIFIVQDFLDMPRDRLSFAVRVRGEIEVFGGLHGAFDLAHVFLGAFAKLPLHFEIFVRQDGAVLVHEVADMTVGGDHFEIGAKVFMNRFGLGGRLDNDKIRGAQSLPSIY